MTKLVVDSGQRQVTILLVDDDEADVKAVRRAFRKADIGNSIVRATDGVEALKLLQTVGEEGSVTVPFMILLDINMPRMNGLELLSEIRNDARWSNTVVFMLTTSKRAEDIDAAYAKHVAGYIAKDNAGSDFLSLVQMLNSYWKIVEFPEIPS